MMIGSVLSDILLVSSPPHILIRDADKCPGSWLLHFDCFLGQANSSIRPSHSGHLLVVNGYHGHDPHSPNGFVLDRFFVRQDRYD